MKNLTGENNERGAATARIVLALGVLLLAAAVVFIAFSSTNAKSDGRAISEKSPDATKKAETAKAPAPEFTLKDLSGKELKLSDYKGRVVVVNFWATWCGPCRAEIPSFVKLRDRYHDEGLEIIGISLDEGDQEAVAGFAERFKINYPIVMGTMETVEAYGPMNAIPTTFVIDRQGQVRSRHLGMMSFSEVEDAIKTLL